ncbi:MAG TPA: Zn-ribbon domain-containing OB-fold protein [Acidothermaceae bacterium]
MEVRRGRAWNRPIPNGEGDYGEFYAACAEGRLLVQRCPACDHRQFYPRPVCTRCGATPEWLECAGTGTVHTYTIIRQYRAEPFGSEVPYALAMIDLPEGPRIFGPITDVDVDDVHIDMPVEAYAVEFEEGRAVPQWRPRASEATAATAGDRGR